MAKEKMKKKIGITDTTLRDAPQSLWATRIRTDEILAIAKEIDDLGYHSVEVWGGATFDVMLRYLDENPWDRLKKVKEVIRKTPLQMLLRGQNIVGYKNYPDDLLEAFICKAAEFGIDIFRVFDALNDVRNLEASFKFVKKTGKHLQGTVCYTISPVHTIEYYVEKAKQQVNLGIDSLCIKDMSGILSPKTAFELVTALKSEIKIPIQMHCHSSSGMATAAYVKGIEAGADIIDCAVAPMALFTSQPPVESLVAILREYDDIDLDIQLNDAVKVSEYFEQVSYKKKDYTKMQSLIDISVIIHQIPGGMVSNLLTQLEQQKALDKLEEVLNEVPKVRKDLGYPPLVTPTSQIVGTQAVFNVLTGERYKIVPEEVKNYVAGFYGKPPVPINEKIKKLILGDRKEIETRPADNLEPILPKVKKELDPSLVKSEEDYITYALFPEIALTYFKWRDNPTKNPAPSDIYDTLKKKREEVTIDKVTKKEKEEILTVKEVYELAKIIDTTRVDLIEIEEKDRRIKLSSNTSVSNMSDFPKNSVTDSNKSVKEEGETLSSPMVGTFYTRPSPDAKPFVSEGDVVEPGKPICIIEAMKMFNQIEAERKMKIIKIVAEDGKPVEFGTPLFIVKYL